METERKIHPLTIGRKNILFFGGEDEVEATLVFIYMLNETSKLNSLLPLDHFTYVFHQLIAGNKDYQNKWVYLRKSLSNFLKKECRMLIACNNRENSTNIVMNKTPLVSICCLTYNHAPYIRECLDGFMMQKVNFSFEVLIHDDASTDGTQDIIREYEKKYPEIMKPIYQKENQYSRGVKISSTYQYPRAKGQYIAFCEGDDYWIDPLKLQKQVDILDKEPSISIVFTERYVLFEHKMKENLMFKKIYTTNDLLGGYILGLQTICFRRFTINVDYTKVNGDILIPYLCSLKGKIYCLHDKTSVYRITRNGVATSRKSKDVLKISLLDAWNFHKVFNFPSKRLLTKAHARYIYQDIIRKIRCFDFNLSNSISEFYSFKRSKIDYFYLVFYLFYFFLLQFSRFIAKLFR